ncbi:uncharacterized protein LOC119985529 [Tripterygium wilfordii]|uniref:uncharacterized protein LOC119985529 n=1 Tax=Tripterygium wilfordii TaxID=458696 RepID=UPI0018F8070F|nr:uncharacterized protein LOC119985529 [Tripterygium wilfordii]
MSTEWQSFRAVTGTGFTTTSSYSSSSFYCSIKREGGDRAKQQTTLTHGRAFALGHQEAPEHPNFIGEEYMDVFLDELPRLPPKREIDFTIELHPNVKPILIPSYRIAPAELKELMTQLEELQELGFIRSSVSLWGAPEFLEISGYHRRFIQDFSCVATPMMQLTRKGTSFVWSDECEKAFKDLKGRLISPPILVVPERSDSRWVRGDVGGVRFAGRLKVPDDKELQEKILKEAHHSRFAMHLGGGTPKDGEFATTPAGGTMEMGDDCYGFCDSVAETPKQNDTVWVIVDRLSKSAHFRYGAHYFGGNWEKYLLLAEFMYNNSYQSSIGMVPFEALYGRPCRSPLCWAEIGEKAVSGPEMVKEARDGIEKIRKRLITAQSWYSKQGKFAPRFVGPFEILELVGLVAYHLALPPKFAKVRNVFHVSILRKYESDPSHVLDWTRLKVEENGTYTLQPMTILDRKDNVTRSSGIPLVKVLWMHHDTTEVTWELESKMKEKYPHLFESLGVTVRIAF